MDAWKLHFKWTFWWKLLLAAYNIELKLNEKSLVKMPFHRNACRSRDTFHSNEMSFVQISIIHTECFLLPFLSFFLLKIFKIKKKRKENPLLCAFVLLHLLVHIKTSKKYAHVNWKVNYFAFVLAASNILVHKENAYLTYIFWTFSPIFMETSSKFCWVWYQFATQKSLE